MFFRGLFRDVSIFHRGMFVGRLEIEDFDYLQVFGLNNFFKFNLTNEIQLVELLNYRQCATTAIFHRIIHLSYDRRDETILRWWEDETEGLLQRKRQQRDSRGEAKV